MKRAIAILALFAAAILTALMMAREPEIRSGDMGAAIPWTAFVERVGEDDER